MIYDTIIKNSHWLYGSSMIGSTDYMGRNEQDFLIVYPKNILVLPDNEGETFSSGSKAITNNENDDGNM